MSPPHFPPSSSAVRQPCGSPCLQAPGRSGCCGLEGYPVSLVWGPLEKAPAGYPRAASSVPLLLEHSLPPRLGPTLVSSSSVSQHSRPGNLQHHWSRNDPQWLPGVSQLRWHSDRLSDSSLQHPPCFLQPPRGVPRPHRGPPG